MHFILLSPIFQASFAYARLFVHRSKSSRHFLCSSDDVFDLLNNIIRQWLRLMGFNQFTSPRIHTLFEGHLTRFTPRLRTAAIK